jgi:hypothetical protein
MTPAAQLWVHQGILRGALTLKVNGKEVGQGRIERSVPGGHTASETFDVGKDLGAPVSLDYYDRAPFLFNGKINSINIKYTE